MAKAKVGWRRARQPHRAWVWGSVAAGLLTGLGLALWWWRRSAPASAAVEDASGVDETVEGEPRPGAARGR